jgi:NTE family protein
MDALRRNCLLASASLLSACAAFDYQAKDSPVALKTPAKLNPPPKVALVLGAGGPRGYAHIGVLKVLEAAGIKIDLLVGSSVGALLGAFWADGYSAIEIDQLANEGGPLTLFDISLFADRGWIHGQRLQDYVNQRMRAKAIEHLARPLIVVATERNTKAPVFFRTGNIGVAVRASSAIPRVISPVGIQGVEYEDADESLPVAVQAARAAGAQFVIAVDVSAHDGTAPPDISPSWIERDQQRRQRIAPEVAQADFVIHPDLGYKASPFKSYFVMAQAKGEQQTIKQLPELKRLLRVN